MIFIDTGAFIARYLERDQHHGAAISQWQRLQNEGRSCFTTNYVLDETITLLARQSTYSFASQRAHNLYESKALIVLRPNEADELQALGLFAKYADQAVSFTDCVSFAMMDRYEIKTAFSFDRHFRIAGYQIEP